MLTIADAISNIELRAKIYQEDITNAKLDIARKEGLIDAGRIVMQDLKQVEEST